MQKKTGIAISIVAGLIAAAYVTEAREYVEVFRQRVVKSFKQSIPLSVELDRMDVLLKDLDSHTTTQKTKVATAKVALEEAEDLLKKSERQRDQMLASLRQVRNGESPASASHRLCSIGSNSRGQQLSFCLNACRQLDEECTARETAVDRQQSAVTKLANHFTKLQSERKLLSHRLSSLRARFEAQQISSTGELSAAESDALARVAKLADQIERDLRIAETAEELENGTASIDESANDTSSIESEVDAFLQDRKES